MTTFERVETLLREHLGFLDHKEVTPDTNLYNDLHADSLDQVEILMAVEEEWGLEIPDAEAEKCLTVGQIVEYLEARSVSDAPKKCGYETDGYCMTHQQLGTCDHCPDRPSQNERGSDD